MLIQSLHPSKTSPRPTVSVVASEILRHWPLVVTQDSTVSLLVNGPDASVPWQVFTPATRPSGITYSTHKGRVVCISFPNAEPSRHRAKRMAVQLLKALK